jgi:hypothetical protein
MAVELKPTTIFDGNRTVSMQFTGISDGAGGLTGVTLVDPALLNPKAKSVKLKKITGQVSYGIVELYWDALPPVKFAELSGDAISINYDKQGTLTNKSAGPDATGKILISTIGFTLNSTFELKLDMTKGYRDQVQVE